MTKNQEIVMWCGLIIVCIYLFIDKGAKTALFGATGSGKGTLQLDSYQPTSSGSNPWGYPSPTPSPSPSAPAKPVPARKPKAPGKITLL